MCVCMYVCMEVRGVGGRGVCVCVDLSVFGRKVGLCVRALVCWSHGESVCVFLCPCVCLCVCVSVSVCEREERVCMCVSTIVY